MPPANSLLSGWFRCELTEYHIGNTAEAHLFTSGKKRGSLI